MIMKKIIVLSFLLITTMAFAQQTEVSGTISDTDGPIAGANIVEKGTTNGTTTDFNGTYTINVAANATLVFSYLGYKTQEIELNGKTTINVTMEEDAAQLDNVTVQGFSGTVGQARRRAESVQSIPESVTTFTAEDIETKGITNVQSFADQVPNLTLTNQQNVGVNFISVRGIPQIRNGDSPVAFVIDGVTIPDPNLLNQDLVDIAMIEVVKGPQGALYGKNAIGGAINILSQEPTNITKNRLVLGYGNANSYKVQFTSNGAIQKDKIFYRLAASYKNFDGLLENETLNKLVDFNRSLNLRGQLKFRFSNNFTANATLQYANEDGGATYYAHKIGSPVGAPLPISPNDFDYVIESGTFGESELNSIFGSVNLEYNLETMKFQSITSYVKADRPFSGDLDFGPGDILNQSQESNSKTFTQEFRLGSLASDSNFSWDLGLFIQNSDRDLITEAFLNVSDPPDYFLTNFQENGVGQRLTDYTNQYLTFAGFGFAEYKVSDKFTLAAGLRYDSDNISQENRVTDIEPSKVQNEIQPKVSLSLQATENMLMFANYGRGYRAGGYNTFPTPAFDAEYDGETSDNFELGLKTNWWNDRLILNLGTFYTKLYNQQQYFVTFTVEEGTVLGNYNYDESEMYGFELDFKLRASKYLDILTSYGINASKIVEGGTAGTTDYSVFNGDNVPFVPQDNLSVGLQSGIDITDKVKLNVFLNYKRTGRIYWTEGPENTDISSNPFNLLDARIGVDFDKFRITLWGANLEDTKYNTGWANTIVWPNRPRTFGVDLAYRF